MKLLLHNGPGVISRLIKWQTAGACNHASILFADGTVFESREFKGVVRTHLAELRAACIREPRLRIDIFRTAYGLCEEKARWFCEAELGCPYDYLGVSRFLTRHRGRSNRAWFCSEFAFAAFRNAGLDLLARTESWEVSPALLHRSPLLRHEGSLTDR
ncbi:MAG: hypothetical protein ABMA13_19015 [Chthoniobacteraceae bacterium]